MKIYITTFLTMFLLASASPLVGSDRANHPGASSASALVEGTDSARRSDSNCLSSAIEFYPESTVDFTYLRNNHTAALDRIEILNSDRELLDELPGIAPGEYTAIDLHGYEQGVYILRIWSVDDLVMEHTLTVGLPN